MTYLNGVEWSSKNKKFIEGLLNHVDDKIKWQSRKYCVEQVMNMVSIKKTNF